MNGWEPIIELPNGSKGNSSFKVSFGEVLIILSVIFGLFFQYLNFNARMSQFEGYTRAKIESIDQELKRINNCIDSYTKGSKR
jgi:hypothetical protein